MEDPDPKQAGPVPRTLGEFLKFTLRRILGRRKWYLIPLWILLVLLAVLIFFSGGSYLLPAIYIAF